MYEQSYPIPTSFLPHISRQPLMYSLSHYLLLFFFFFFSFFFLSFSGCIHSIWRFPGQGLNRSCSCWPTPQPQLMPDQSCICDLYYSSQQCPILHPWARPGIKPASSCILVRFVSAKPRQELCHWLFLTFHIKLSQATCNILYLDSFT